MEAEQWIKQVEEHIKSLEGLNPGDRLQAVTAIGRCWLAVHQSQLGWSSWLKDIRVFEGCEFEELVAIFNQFRDLAIMFLNFDVDATKTVTTQLKEKQAAEQPKSSKDVYVS